MQRQVDTARLTSSKTVRSSVGVLASKLGSTPSVRNPKIALIGGLTVAALVMFLMSEFVRRSVWLGLWGLTNDLEGLSPFFASDKPVVTFLMFLHMITGAAMILFCPLQLIGSLRRKYPRLHRWNGRLLATLGLVTGAGGVFYALLRGTTGGTYMDVSSTLYGVLFLLASVQTLRFGLKRSWAQHRRWGLRLVTLGLASWFYRLHYVVWHEFFGDLWITPDMRGPFDVFQAFAFYLSYLFLLELFFLWEKSRRPTPQRA
ncbi:MAG: DUF2306 domain-containing protein [Pseudomonadota bacterium]